MKLSRPLLFAFVLSVAPSLASAAKPTLVEWVRTRVDTALVAPLTKLEASRSRFSRVRMPPGQRRVRVLKATASRDAEGREFLPFAVDVRYGSEWTKDDIRGCAYKGKGDLFVKIGDTYRPAAFLLGKDVEPVTGVCKEAQPSA